MKKLIPLALLLLCVTAGCKSGEPAPDASPALPAEETPEVSLSVSPIPSPTPAPTPTPVPEPEPYDYTVPVAESEAVEDAWFADAVFIGDSRTDGLRLYSGIRDVDFLCYKGLTVFEVMNDKQVIQTEDGKLGVLQALEKKQYARVYISLGVNELGYNHDQGFMDTYSAMVDKVRELQPDADIYLQKLIPVNPQKCRETKQASYVTNEQIAVYNGIIETVAAEKEVYLLDVGEAFTDENGELPYDASVDGIHFKRDGYSVWYDYLKTHTVEEEAE